MRAKVNTNTEQSATDASGLEWSSSSTAANAQNATAPAIYSPQNETFSL